MAEVGQHMPDGGKATQPKQFEMGDIKTTATIRLKNRIVELARLRNNVAKIVWVCCENCNTNQKCMKIVRMWVHKW